MIKLASKILAHKGESEDKIKVVHFNSSKVSAVLADGADSAGGSSGGGVSSGGVRAAELVVETLSNRFPEDIGVLFDSIINLDRQLQLDSDASYASVVSVYVDGSNFIGAVVGGSDAMLIKDSQIKNLAPEKEIKPLLGDGEAFPTMYSGSIDNSILVVCSDGLSKYISVENVLHICTHFNEPEKIISELLLVVELPDGQLQDDISIVVMSGEPAQELPT